MYSVYRRSYTVYSNILFQKCNRYIAFFKDFIRENLNLSPLEEILGRVTVEADSIRPYGYARKEVIS